MRNGRVVHFIDTPGFDDSFLTDADILLTVATYLTKDVRLTGLIYLHRISDIRVGGSSKKNLGLFTKLVGRENMRNVVLLSTMWKTINLEDGLRRMREILTDKHWGPLIQCGALFETDMDGNSDSWRVVERILQYTPIQTKIQKQMENGVPLTDTDTGREVYHELQELNRRYAQDLEELTGSLLEAIESRNQYLEYTLRQHYQKMLQEQQLAMAAQQRVHDISVVRLRAQMENQVYNERNRGQQCTLI
jgi:hypothetical protein